MPFPLLLWLQIPIDDPQAMKMVQGQRQLSQVELDILLSEHDLEGWERIRVQLLPRLLVLKHAPQKPGLSQNTRAEILALP